MKSSAEFCTCKNFDCQLHPVNHESGCNPCISKNLKLKDIPNCFFYLVDGLDSREGYSFEDFARLVLKDKSEESNPEV